MKERLWTRSYIMAVTVMFGIYMVSSILLSVMAIHAKNLTGLDIYAGMMVSTFTLGALSVRFLAGALIDRFSSKKIILAGLAILVIGSLWLLIGKDITAILFARVLQGIGFGLSATATSTMIAMICHPSRLLEGISYNAVVQSLTAVLGPSLGFWIIGAEYNQFSTLFLLATGIAVATFFIMSFEKNASITDKTHPMIQEHSKPIAWSLICLSILVLFMNALSQSAITSFLALYAISMNLVGVGSFFSINAVGMITSRFIMNRLVKRYGELPMILMNTIIFGGSVLLLTQASSLLHMLVLAFPAGFAMGSIAPIINTYLVQTLPGNKKGLANALYFSSLDIGYMLGSIFWGLIATKLGYVPIFYLSAILQGLAILITLLQMRLLRKNNTGVILEAK